MVDMGTGDAWRAGTMVCIAVALAAIAWPAAAWPEAAAPSSQEVRKLPENVRKDVDDIARHLLEVQRTDVELACGKAVENARWGLQTMLEVGERNMAGGYLSRADFEASAGPLRTMLAGITDDDCNAATGSRQAFYRCMSSDYNHVMACARQME